MSMYEIPYGYERWNINYDSTDYTPSTGLWNIICSFKCEGNIETSKYSGANTGVLIKKYREFAAIHKPLMANLADTYYAYKALEGETVTLTPHIDEDGITYSCIVQLVELRPVDNDPQDMTIVIRLTEDDID